MSRIKEEQPWFKIDPDTGKCIALPVNLQLVNMSSGKKRTNTAITKNEQLTKDILGRPPKIRKTEKSVRKELFKPPKKHQVGVHKTTNTNVKVANIKGDEELKPLISPLTDMRQAEVEKVFTFKSPLITIESPSPTENCKLKSSHERKLLILEVKIILENYKSEFDKFKVFHESKMNSINDILNKLEKDEQENHKQDDKSNDKENEVGSRRRSLRLLNRSPVIGSAVSESVVPFFEPNILDLRKHTLTKNLEIQNSSPRTQKAINLYNTTRGIFSDSTFLSTPKLDKNFMTEETPRSKDLKSDLSRKIQKQCLLLQDTPLRK